jgi:hypothetical protein
VTGEMIIEMVGYLGSLLVLISFLMSSVVKLRVVNSVGALIFAIYALIIHSYPTAFMNFCLIGINIYYLMRLTRSSHRYSVVKGKLEDPFVQHFLNFYREDIQVYFPGTELEASGIDGIYLVCHDAVLAGVLLGSHRENGTLEIYLDYTTPEYRDCSVGAFLYEQLSGQGIRKLTFYREAEKHIGYLKKMGFVKEENGFAKELV